MLMTTLRTLGTLALTVALGFAAAPSARADVYVLDILSRKAGVSAHEADSYNGALGLIARRYGGVRVSTFHESNVAGEPGARLVGLWRFPNARAVEALLADANYAQIVRLRDRSFEHGESATLQLVADRSERSPAIQ
jgi:hypothetical protein